MNDTEWFQGYGTAVPVVVHERHSWQSDLVNAFVVTAFAWACICIACGYLVNVIRYWRPK